MNSIRIRNDFALGILSCVLLVATAAAGSTADSAPLAPPGATAAAPNGPAPAFTPPAAPDNPAPPADEAHAFAPPSSEAAAAPTAPAAPGGQWVYTSQYGWVWMPYASAYTFVAADGGTAYMYVYEPAYGWRWVFAPWVLGWGPRPAWGALGPVRFAWYSHPWFRGVGHRAPVLHARAWHRR